MVDKQLISEIKNSVNIVDVIGEVVQLTKAGRNFLGLCPFHGEKTPSFNVVEDKQFYHCFGCGKSGDVFKFIEDYRGVSFMEAVQIVGDQVGIQVQALAPSQSRGQQTDGKQPFYEIHQEAAKFYHAILMTTKMGEEARNYLHERGLTDEVIRHFQLGLAPAEGNYLYRNLSEKFSEKVITDSGLFTISDAGTVFDAFQDRIMFPLTDDSGRVIAFSGRLWKKMDDGSHQAKYKNSRSTRLFNKSYELYHLDQAKTSAKKQHEMYIMEGFMDVIAAYRAGIENAVASMGTALTPEHVQHLSHFTKKVILTYDGDKAGLEATAKALDVLQDLELEIVRIPDQMDPDEYLKKTSPEDLATLLKNSRISKVEFLMHYWKPQYIENLQAQIEFVEKLAPMIAQTRSITAQNTYIYKLADLLPDFDYLQIEQIVNNSRLQQRQEAQIGGRSKTSHFSVELLPNRGMTRLIKAENHLLSRMKDFPMVLNDYRLRPDFAFDTPELQILYQLLCQNGEVTSQDLSEQPEGVQHAWYRMLEEDLPDEIADGELEEVEATRNRELLRKESQQIGNKVKEASSIGDAEKALLELERLIAQKRRME